jgi:hypothetical protein
MKKENKDNIYAYILDDGRLYVKELEEKDLENYVYYRLGDIVIVNKDYNKVKPLVKKLLQKQSILKDWGKLSFLVSMGLIFVVIFVWFSLYSKLSSLDNNIKIINNDIQYLS